MSEEFTGKVAIVTGAGGGIGAVVATVLAERGASVILAGPKDTGLESTVEKIVNAGHIATSCIVDISDEASVQALMTFARETYGRLDILDNNAACQGLPEDSVVTSMPVDIWDRVHSVNARGTMLMCKHAVLLMLETGGGSIINMSSGTASAGDFFSTAYACSKAAVNTLTQYVATQYGAQGIRCNAIAAGLVDTPALQAGMPDAIREIFTANKLVKRVGQPQDVAEMICFLASDKSSWISGQIYPVDGGFYSHMPTTVEVERLMQAASPD